VYLFRGRLEAGFSEASACGYRFTCSGVYERVSGLLLEILAAEFSLEASARFDLASLYLVIAMTFRLTVAIGTGRITANPTDPHVEVTVLVSCLLYLSNDTLVSTTAHGPTG
jgi:hypothetical protein